MQTGQLCGEGDRPESGVQPKIQGILPSGRIGTAVLSTPVKPHARPVFPVDPPDKLNSDARLVRPHFGNRLMVHGQAKGWRQGRARRLVCALAQTGYRTYPHALGAGGVRAAPGSVGPCVIRSGAIRLPANRRQTNPTERPLL
jgi:hypothetical protein